MASWNLTGLPSPRAPGLYIQARALALDTGKSRQKNNGVLEAMPPSFRTANSGFTIGHSLTEGSDTGPNVA